MHSLSSKITIHADDFGVDCQVSQAILECINSGAISSISIICNTTGFEDSIKQLSSSSQKVNLRLHLNLVEGTPVLNRSEVNLLTNKTGEFRFTFLSLWIYYLLSPGKIKRLLKKQIELEVVAQIKKYQKQLHLEEISLDSHTHMHMIPFVFNSLIRIAKRYNITFIRMPNEPFFLSKNNLKSYFSINLIKHFVLNFLSKIHYKKLKSFGISSNNQFIGVLHTGKMSTSILEDALNQIKKVNSLEVLFHPGGVGSINDVTWTKKQSFRRYYSLIDRMEEAKELKSGKINYLLQRQ